MTKRETGRTVRCRRLVDSVDFMKVFDEAPTPFLLLTPDFKIVHANERAWT